MKDNEKATFTTSRGVTVGLTPIPYLLDKIRQQHPEPQPPTYEVTGFGDVTEQVPHTAQSLETDEDRAAWAIYEKAKAENAEALGRATMRAVFLRGMQVEVPEDDDWIEEQEFLGIVVPDDPRERRLHYIETEVLGDPLDMVKIMIAVGGASGVSEEALATAEASFRRALEGAALEQFAPETG